jgi:hypothetical protein
LENTRSNQLESISRARAFKNSSRKTSTRLPDDHSVSKLRNFNENYKQSSKKMAEAAEDTKSPLIAARERGMVET